MASRLGADTRTAGGTFGADGADVHHIATACAAGTGADDAARQSGRVETGEPLLHNADRAAFFTTDTGASMDLPVPATPATTIAVGRNVSCPDTVNSGAFGSTTCFPPEMLYCCNQAA